MSTPLRRLSLCALLLAASAFRDGGAVLADDQKTPERSPTPTAAQTPPKDKWAGHRGALDFVDGYERGMARVRMTGRPPMFFVTTTTCVFCRQLAGEAFTDADVVAELAHFTPVLVDGEAESGVAAKYSVSSFPTVIFADTTGKQSSQVRGYVATATFLEAARKARKECKAGTPSKAYRELERADSDLTAALAKSDVKAALEAARRADDTGLDHPLAERARAERARLLQSGAERLVKADAARAAGKLEEARTELRKVAEAYAGTDVGTQAERKLRALDDATGK